MYADPKDKANILDRQYESVFTKEKTTSIPKPDGLPFLPMPDINMKYRMSFKATAEGKSKQSQWTRHDTSKDPETVCNRTRSNIEYIIQADS